MDRRIAGTIIVLLLPSTGRLSDFLSSPGDAQEAAAQAMATVCSLTWPLVLAFTLWTLGMIRKWFPGNLSVLSLSALFFAAFLIGRFGLAGDELRALEGGTQGNIYTWFVVVFIAYVNVAGLKVCIAALIIGAAWGTVLHLKMPKPMLEKLDSFFK